VHVIAMIVTLTALVGMPPAPGVVKYEVPRGTVTFDHPKHLEGRQCRDCHDGPARKMVVDKQSAHTLCVGCHAARRAGPKACSGCHVEEE
jgi:predicted CXXCH cytochrome family protein